MMGTQSMEENPQPHHQEKQAYKQDVQKDQAARSGAGADPAVLVSS